MNSAVIKKIKQSAALCFCIISLVSCGGGMSSDSNKDAGSTDALTVTTYNTGLATGFIDHATGRQPKIIEALNSLESDVVCLQEVWSDTDRDAIISGVSANYPHSYNYQTEQVVGNSPSSCFGTTAVAGLGANFDALLAPVLSCYVANCATSGTSLPDCIAPTGACYNDYLSLYLGNPECVETLQANIALSGDLNTFIGTSLAADVDYAYNGRNGLLLLSKTALSNTDSIDFVAGTNKRNALYATVTKGGVDHHVACTHLTADMGSSAAYTRNAYVTSAAADATAFAILQEIAGPNTYDALQGGLATMKATLNASSAGAGNLFESIAITAGQNHYANYYPTFLQLFLLSTDAVTLKKGWESYAGLPTSVKAALDIEAVRTAIAATDSLATLSAALGSTDMAAAASLIYRAKGWEYDNAVQVSTLIAQMTARAGSAPQYITGDLNCSVDSALYQIDGEFEGNCELLTAAGYHDAVAVSENSSPTFASDNSLNAGEHTGDKILDHVFTKNVRTAQTAEIVLNDEVSITFDNTSTGNSHLSDHYGVRVVVPIN